MERHLWVPSKVDLLLRTGESRLSGFLLYQSCESTKFIMLRSVLWPDFSAVHLAWVIFQYQFAM